MKVLRKVNAAFAKKKLMKTAEHKFVANVMTSMCICRCSDG